MTVQLTDAQRNMFVVLLDMMTEEGRTPTIRELCKRAGIRSTNGVAEHLARLRLRGLLAPADDPRRLEVADRGWDLWAEVLAGRFGREVSPVEAELLTLTSRALSRRGTVEVIGKASGEGAWIVAIRVAARSAHDGQPQLADTLSA